MLTSVHPPHYFCCSTNTVPRRKSEGISLHGLRVHTQQLRVWSDSVGTVLERVVPEMTWWTLHFLCMKRRSVKGLTATWRHIGESGLGQFSLTSTWRRWGIHSKYRTEQIRPFQIEARLWYWAATSMLKLECIDTWICCKVKLPKNRKREFISVTG